MKAACPGPAFVRKYGELRRMGAARRDRERPDLQTRLGGGSAVVPRTDWARFPEPAPGSEPQEYAYIPDDLLPLLPALRADTPPPLGRPATPNEVGPPHPGQ